MSGIVTRLVEFAGALRARGLPVSLGDEVDAARALTLVDLFDLDEVRRAVRISLKVRRADWDVFDALFDAVWLGRPSTSPAQPRPGRVRDLAARSPHPVPWLERAVGEGERAAGGATEGRVPGYSPDVLLRKKSFDSLSVPEIAAMDRLLGRLAFRLATERSRRLVPTSGRGVVDLRRSLRRAVATRGELVSLARRARAVEAPRLVILCDTSGSMEAHTRFLLTFVISLKRVVRRVEVFAFNTALTRLTQWLVPGKIGLTLERLAAGVADWAGGTRIGECLAEFVTRYQSSVVSARTVVIILSDGLDRGEPDVLVRAMRAIRSRARRVIWLNPLLGDPRYEPAARGMQAALPYVDRFGSAHNLESLERLVEMLAA